MHSATGIGEGLERYATERGPAGILKTDRPVESRKAASKARNEEAALKTLIDPELLLAAGQPLQVFLHIGCQVGHRDHPVPVSIDVLGGQRVEENLGDGSIAPGGAPSLRGH